MAKRDLKRDNSCSPLLETLESRVLYSADPVGVLLGGAADDFDHQVFDDSNADAFADVLTHASATEIILVNSDVPDVDGLYQAILQQTANRNAVIYTLDADQDGIEQTRQLLSRHHSVDAVHLFSHGSAGSFALGATHLDADSARLRADDLQDLGELFNDSADFLIYGCETGLQGSQLLGLLADRMQVDIAASDDLSGNEAGGGDWELEVVTGDIEQSALFEDGLADEWSGLLATITVTTTADVFDADTDISTVAELIADPGADGFISLREAIFAANLETDADVIELQGGTYVSAITGGGNDAGDYDIRESVTIRGLGADSTTIDVSGNGGEIGFDINGNSVVFEDFTLTGAAVSDGSKGAAIDADGVDLTLDGLVIDGNQTDTGVGGAVYIKSNATATVKDSTFSNNTAGQGAAPDFKAGGAIYSDGTLRIVRSTFNDNSGQNGGAIYSTGPLIIEDSSFVRNTASQAGGAVFYKAAGGSLEMDRVTFD